MSLHYLVNAKPILLVEGIVSLETLVALKRTGYVVWQLECQASNVTASVQSDPTVCTVRFQSFSSLMSHTIHHAVLKFSPCLDKPLPQLAVSRIDTWYTRCCIKPLDMVINRV